MPISLTINAHKIETELKKRGINVALERSEKTKFFRSFRKKLREELFAQIEFIARDAKKMETLVAMVKLSLKEQIAAFLVIKSIGDKIDFARFLIWAGTRGGQEFLNEIEVDEEFDLRNPELIEFFDDHSQLLIETVDDTTAKWIALKIQRGKRDGLSVDQIAETLISDGRKISKRRAQLIAMNELINAMTIVELEAARRYNIEEKIWRTSIDDRVCPICIPLEGKKTKINRPFATSEGPVQGPPAHVGCRCFLEEVIPSKWELPDNIWLGA